MNFPMKSCIYKRMKLPGLHHHFCCWFCVNWMAHALIFYSQLILIWCPLTFPASAAAVCPHYPPSHVSISSTAASLLARTERKFWHCHYSNINNLQFYSCFTILIKIKMCPLQIQQKVKCFSFNSFSTFCCNRS